MTEDYKEIFYRIKGDIPWFTGVVLDQDNGLFKIGGAKYSIGIWYSEKDIEIKSRSAKP